MKTTFSKLLACLALLLLCATLLLACQSTPDDGVPQSTEDSIPAHPESSSEADEESSEGEGSTEEPDDGLFHIAEDGVFHFSIVCGSEATAMEGAAMTDLHTALITMTGCRKIVVTDDAYHGGKDYNSADFEILVGKTVFPESEEALRDLPYGSYAVRAIGNKIVVNAWNDAYLKKAVHHLIEELRVGLNGKNLVIDPSTLDDTVMVDKMLDNLPEPQNKKASHIYDANGATELIYENTLLSDFENYLTILDGADFTLYTENQKGKVSSAILYHEKQGITLNVFHEGAYGELCVIVEAYDEARLPPKEAAYEKVCDTALVQFGTEYPDSNNQNGMSYVWRLENGKFVILDGGFNTEMHADHLYSVLEKLAPDPNNIVITSWIISHFHNDHAGILRHFGRKYATSVTLESMLFYLPTADQFVSADASQDHWTKFEERYLHLYTDKNPDFVIYKAHPGQIYHFANLAFEVLYTLEMYAPKQLTYFNTSSLVLNVSFGTFDMLMLGDMSEDSNKIILENYGDALVSEAVQVAHHGSLGGTLAFYRMVKAEYVLWPVGTVKFKEREKLAKESPSSDRNAYFYAKDTTVKQIFVAKDDVFVFCLEKDTGFVSVLHYENASAFATDTPTDTSLIR